MRIILSQGVCYLACYAIPGGLLSCALRYPRGVLSFNLGGVVCNLARNPRGCRVYYCVLCYPTGCVILRAMLSQGVYYLLSQGCVICDPRGCVV